MISSGTLIFEQFPCRCMIKDDWILFQGRHNFMMSVRGIAATCINWYSTPQVGVQRRGATFEHTELPWQGTDVACEYIYMLGNAWVCGSMCTNDWPFKLIWWRLCERWKTCSIFETQIRDRCLDEIPLTYDIKRIHQVPAGTTNHQRPWLHLDLPEIVSFFPLFVLPVWISPVLVPIAKVFPG